MASFFQKLMDVFKDKPETAVDSKAVVNSTDTSSLKAKTPEELKQEELALLEQRQNELYNQLTTQVPRADQEKLLGVIRNLQGVMSSNGKKGPGPSSREGEGRGY